MNNLYELTQKIHELLPQVAEKCGVKFEAESDAVIFLTDILNQTKIGYSENYISDSDVLMMINRTGICIPEIIACEWQFKIEDQQIRQILVGLSEVLVDGQTIKNAQWFRDCKETDVCPYCRSGIPQLYSKVLCQRWLDGLNPLFAREPEKVLQELIEVLENLIN